jgi:glycosidase
MQNLFDSHDTNRLLSHIVNQDLGKYREWSEYFELSKGSNLEYLKSKPTDKEIEIQKLMAIFQFTYVGAPMIYYGDEAGMWGANDPDCRKPMIWDDIDYDDERCLPDQSKYESPKKVKFNRELFNHYKKLAGIRDNNIELQLGDFRTLLTDNDNGVYIFERNFKNEKVIVAINNGHNYCSAEIKTQSNRLYTDELNSEYVKADTSGILRLNIKPKWGRIII